jgi:hypothetical protein
VNRGAVIGRYHFGSLKWIGITNLGGSMRRLVMLVLTGLFVAPAALVAQTAPCRIVTITGSQGGPGLCNGLAGPGTLVRYGGQFVSPQLVGSERRNHVCKHEMLDARPPGHRPQIAHRALTIIHWG